VKGTDFGLIKVISRHLLQGNEETRLSISRAGSKTRHLLSIIPTSYYLCQLVLRCMTSGFRHNLKDGGNRDNFRGSSKVFTWRDRKDCRNPQSEYQVPKTLSNNSHSTTKFSTQTRTCLRSLYYGRQSCRRLVCQRRGIRRKQLRAFIRSTDCEVYRRQCYCRLSFRSRQQNHAAASELSEGDSLHSDSKYTCIHVSRHNEFVNWVVFSLNCNLNN